MQVDFRAVRAHTAADCVYLFHDVATFALHSGIERITRESGPAAQLLLGTTSGMAIVYDQAQRPVALDDIAPFVASPETVALIEDAAWSHRRRHLARWRKSQKKRLGGSRKACDPSTTKLYDRLGYNPEKQHRFLQPTKPTVVRDKADRSRPCWRQPRPIC